MTAPSGKPAQRHLRNLNVPLAPLKMRAVRDRSVKAADSGLVARIRSEFIEMRGFSPTLQQAGRLFHLGYDECRQVLAALIDEGFLREEHDGRYRLSRHR